MIKAAVNAQQGLVSTPDSIRLSEFKSGCAILARNNAPIVELALRFVGAGRSVAILGKDVGASLISTIESAKATSLSDLKLKLDASFDKKKARAHVKNQETLYQTLEDTQSCFTYLCSKVVSISALVELISKLFVSTATCDIILSTVHRAKGLEWPIVYLLEVLTPSKNPKLSDVEKQQEKNIKYVAVTRAKDELFVISRAIIKN